MIVIADTTPLNYLVLIEQAEILPQLYNRVFIPPAVWEEFQRPETPSAVRAWIAHPRGSKSGVSRGTPSPRCGIWAPGSGRRSRWRKSFTRND
jgi:hypothetical protein